MPPRKRSPAENTFLKAIEALDSMTAEAPVANDVLHASLATVEAAGTLMVVDDSELMGKFAEAMHRLFLAAGTLEVEPPYTQLEMASIRGKVAMYGSLIEVAEPKPVATKKAATPTKAIKTDGRKA